MRNVHHVAVDKRKSPADSGLVLIGAAIKDALGDRSQAWLGEQLDLDPSVVSRIISGRIAELTVDRVAEIEQVLGVTAGTLLRAGGYVADQVTVADAITADATLNPEQKRTLRNVYDLAISSQRRPARKS